jgi:hypothetical protein
MGALDAFGYKWFGDNYNPNLRAGTLRATDDTPYYETGDKYKWGAKSQQSLRNTLKDIVKAGKYTGVTQE